MNPITYVKWEDANRSAEWTDSEAVDADPTVCESLGFVVASSPRAITLALTTAPGQVCCQMTILRANIIEQREVTIGEIQQTGLGDRE